MFRILILLIAVSACDRLRPSPATPGPAVQRLVDFYAPGITLGEPLQDSVRARYSLAVAPYVGLRDSTYRGPEGVRDLHVTVDQHVDKPDATVSSSARVETVSLQAASSPSAAIVSLRIRRTLGSPRTSCYEVPDQARYEARYWPAQNGRGVLVLVSRGPLRPIDAYPPGSVPPPLGAGTVTFGAEPLDVKQLDEIPCDSGRS